MKKKIAIFVAIVVALVGLTTTVILAAKPSKDEPEETTTKEETKPSVNVAFLNKTAKLSDVKKVEGVVNVYMFWGAGCPHCKAQWQWLESISDQYEGKVAVYGFEVFNDSENRLLMDNIADLMGDGEVNTVPYTVIGDKSINGFTNGSTSGKKILEYIERAEKNGKDVYFDKLRH